MVFHVYSSTGLDWILWPGIDRQPTQLGYLVKVDFGNLDFVLPLCVGSIGITKMLILMNNDVVLELALQCWGRACSFMFLYFHIFHVSGTKSHIRKTTKKIIPSEETVAKLQNTKVWFFSCVIVLKTFNYMSKVLPTLKLNTSNSSISTKASK